jgi:hypothetical protein
MTAGEADGDGERFEPAPDGLPTCPFGQPGLWHTRGTCARHVDEQEGG